MASLSRVTVVQYLIQYMKDVVVEIDGPSVPPEVGVIISWMTSIILQKNVLVIYNIYKNLVDFCWIMKPNLSLPVPFTVGIVC